MTKQISILLGAGFSMPAGYPSAKELNQRVRETKKEDLKINSNGIVVNARYYPDLETFSSYSDKYNELIEAIKYYNNQKNGNFDYEEFYDYLEKEIQKDADFRRYYESKYEIKHGDFFCNSLTDIYSQILTFYIQPDNSKSHSPYCAFVKCVMENADKGNIMHIHTLNHDRLFEDLFKGKYSDGFTLENSPYFVDCLIKGFPSIDIPYYKEDYTENIRLYKLHGSLDQYRYSEDNVAKATWVKVPSGYDFTEIKDKRGNRCWYNYHPDFLTGKTSKMKDYDKSFYKTLLSHFETNIEESESIVIIGYSGGDERINEILKKGNGKRSIILPSKDQKFIDEMENAGWKVIDKKIEEVSYEDLEKIIDYE